ncbi:MAG: phosphoribosylformylglycinamidine synthase subunit PurQ [Acidobacteria bacterium]|nr:phosphoribosylformylglycinamidine synthase subunit PurQ [Acidobacteriota bacterium]
MKFGVVVFPGSNCDHDTYHVISKVLGQPVNFIWHKSEAIEGHDAIILPGGFSYGNYLRTGAIACHSPVMQAVKRFAADGGLVLGICNGFQILCESGLLPGTLLRNRDLKYLCRDTPIRVEQTGTPFTAGYHSGQILRIPIAHGEGNYFCDESALSELEERGQVVLRYCNENGEATSDSNPNGSLNNIAGICNTWGNVLGLMPHPERAAESILGSKDGRALFISMVDHLTVKHKARS